MPWAPASIGDRREIGRAPAPAPGRRGPCGCGRVQRLAPGFGLGRLERRAGESVAVAPWTPGRAAMRLGIVGEREIDLRGLEVDARDLHAHAAGELEHRGRCARRSSRARPASKWK